VTVPDFVCLDTAEDLDRVDWSQGPKVLKRRNFVGGMDVHILRSADRAQEVWRAQGRPGLYELESFVAGEMFHCDSVVDAGRVVFSSVSRYLARPGDFAPGGLSGSVIVRSGDLRQRILDVNGKVLGRLGLDSGVTHLEVFHSPADEIVFCEIAARPGGGGIERMNERAYGVNFIEYAIALESGLPIPDPPGARDDLTWGRVGMYPGGASDRGIGSSDFARFGIVEHQHHPSATGPRHCTDYRDQYIVRAPDEAAFADRVEAMRRAYGAR
jgi:hypothetical protein